MTIRMLPVAMAFALVAGCGAPQPTPPAPQPEPAAAPEAAPDAGPAAEPAPAPAPAEPEKPALKTPENLQAAYAGATDAVARYKAFAEAADKEKHPTVGALFRAYSRSAEILAKGIAEKITAQGGTPAAGTGKPEVKKTADNVKAALEAETAAGATTFPGYAATAKEEGNGDAERLFKGLAEVAGEHAKLLKRVDKDLPGWKRADKEFWVCPVCGHVMTSKKESCGICATDPSAFEQVE